MHSLLRGLRRGASSESFALITALHISAVVTFVQTQTTARTFSDDAGMMFHYIKPDRVADFEMVMGKLKEALARSSNPIRQQQAASWKVFKAQEAGPDGSVLYIFFMDPVVKDADYTVSTILAEALPTEVQDLYKTFSDAYASGQNLVNFHLIVDLAGGPTP